MPLYGIDNLTTVYNFSSIARGFNPWAMNVPPLQGFGYQVYSIRY